MNFTNLTNGLEQGGGSSATTASITLTANRLGLLTVTTFIDSGSTSPVPTVTGWTTVASNEFKVSGTLRHRQTLLRRLAGSNSTGALTINIGVGTYDIFWSVDESDAGVDTSGTNGSGAIVQAVTATGVSGTALATLASFASASNATFGSLGTAQSSGNITEGSGFTALSEIIGGSFTDTSMFVEWKGTADTTVDATFTSTDWCMIGVEVAAGGGGGPTIESRSLSSAGSASPGFQSAAIASTALTSAGAATPSFQSAAINSRTLSSAGAATPTFNSATVLPASLSSAGVGAAAFTSSAIVAAALSSAGAGSFSPLSSAISAVTLGSAGVATVSFVGEDANSNIAERSFSPAGVAAVSFSSASIAPAALTSQGAAAVLFVSEQVGVIAASLNISGQASVNFQSEALGERSGSGGKNWAMRAWQDDLLEPYVVEAQLRVEAGARVSFSGRAIRGKVPEKPIAPRIVGADLIARRRSTVVFSATPIVRDGALLRIAKPMRLIRHTCTHCGGSLHP